MTTARRSQVLTVLTALAVLAPAATRAAVQAPASAATPPAAAASSHAPGTARVTYLAGGSVYLDAGRAEGLHEGDTLMVARDGATVARLRALYLSSHRAACDTLPGSPLPRVGDVASFVPRLEAAPPAAMAPAPGAAMVPTGAPAAELPAPRTVLMPNPPRAVLSRVRGRLGARLLAIQSREAGDLTQPALDARVEAVDAGGLPIDLVADVRGRHTTVSGRAAAGSGTVESSTRVYRLAASLHDAVARYRLTLGRQASPMLASVSLFDGAMGQWGAKRWSLGAFSGTQPDPVRLTLSSEILQNGAFVEAHQAPLAVRRWSMALGAVTSSAHGQANRDYAFAQASYHDPRVSLSLAQEADLQRGWKRDSVGSSFSLTSTFATVNLQAAPGLSLYAGYDGRRNVRLYRDRETPETVFDDRFRQGGWVGGSADLGAHLRISGDGRSMGTASDHSNAWSASGELLRLTRANGRLRARYSRADASLSRSRLLSFGLGLDPLDGAHLELGGGTRSTSDLASSLEDRATWTDADLDVSFLRRLLFSMSWEHTSGILEHVDQEYGGLSIRF